MQTINNLIVASVAVLILACVSGKTLAASKPNNPMPEATEEFVEKGRGIYFQRCSFAMV